MRCSIRVLSAAMLWLGSLGVVLLYCTTMSLMIYSRLIEK